MKFEVYCLENNFLKVETTPIGAGVHAIFLKQNDNFRKVTAHPPQPSSYLNHNYAYFGSTCGRTCNRIRNARYVRGKEKVVLSANEKNNHLHGGERGFSFCQFDTILSTPELVHYRLESADNDQGYPGAVTAEVIYQLLPNGLKIDYRAKTTKTTPINLTNHTYFNLAADSKTNVLAHNLAVHADRVLHTDAERLFTSKTIPVDELFPRLAGGKKIFDLLTYNAQGADHCFVINPQNTYALMPQVELSFQNVLMRISSTQPCIQVYTGYFLDNHSYADYSPEKFSGLALESCGYPDAVNIPDFPGAFVEPGQLYAHTTQWEFSMP